MISFRYFLLSALPLAMLVTTSAKADAIFTFSDVAAGTVTPFTSTVNGLSATFTGSASVCDVTAAGFNTLSGNALIQDFCNPPQLGPVNIGFSSSLSSVSFNFATAFGPSGTLTLQAYNGTTLVGTSVFTSSVPPGNFPNGEGVASFSGSFNSLVLTSSSILAVDNINAVTGTSAVPEPASLSMFAAGSALLLGLARGFRKRKAN